MYLTTKAQSQTPPVVKPNHRRPEAHGSVSETSTDLGLPLASFVYITAIVQ